MDQSVSSLESESCGEIVLQEETDNREMLRDIGRMNDIFVDEKPEIPILEKPVIVPIEKKTKKTVKKKKSKKPAEKKTNLGSIITYVVTPILLLVLLIVLFHPKTSGALSKMLSPADTTKGLLIRGGILMVAYYLLTLSGKLF